MAKTLTLLLMDPPFESANTTTAFRLVDAALRKGHTVNVFAYEGAVNLTMKGQQQHPNPAHGKTVEEEQHPLTRDIVSGLFTSGGGDRLRWINCGLCVDECPVKAIFTEDDVPAEWKHYVQINADHFKK